MNDKLPGWYSPTGALKSHLFIHDKSLCLKHVLQSSDEKPLPEWDGTHTDDDCKECVRIAKKFYLKETGHDERRGAEEMAEGADGEG